MDQPIAYLNGQFLPADRAMLPVYDAGFALGATITEQLRTFGGKLFRIEQHMQRLERSLAVCGLTPEIEIGEFASIAGKLVEHNHRLLEPGDDLGLAIFVTPGPYYGDRLGPHRRIDRRAAHVSLGTRSLGRRLQAGREPRAHPGRASFAATVGRRR